MNKLLWLYPPLTLGNTRKIKRGSLTEDITQWCEIVDRGGLFHAMERCIKFEINVFKHMAIHDAYLMELTKIIFFSVFFFVKGILLLKALRRKRSNYLTNMKPPLQSL